MSGLQTGTDAFLEEARELVDVLENQLLALEENADTETVNAAFRAMHTLKGSGEMFGFAALAGFVHHLESAFDAVRSGNRPVTAELIAVALDSRDHIAALLNAGPGAIPTARLAATGDALIARLGADDCDDCGARDASATADAPDTHQGAMTAAAPPRSVTIFFQPEQAALRNGFRPDILLDELAALGRLSVTCAGDDVPPIEELDPTACHLAWTLELETAANRQEIEDVFIFVADGELRIQDAADPAPGAGRAAPTEENAAPPGPRHDVPPEEATTAVAAKATAAAATGKTARAATSPGASARAEATPNGVAEERGQSAGSQGGASIRVPSRRLDDLMDQLGELVIAQARLRRVARDLGDLALDATAEEIERLVTGLRDTTLSMRMVPISLAFAKFRRLLRDLSRELGKDVQLRTLGGETEVDKNVFDSLTEPLVHMVRNAVDHGIDDTADRLAAGKPAVGTITLAARQSGGEVLISVHDDGRGLDSERIRRRAADRGLIPEDQMMSEAEIRQLIFAPGFSTAETVSSVSGRGVGMDAVRRTVEGLRGTIEVTSTLGQGTEITMRLPLTLAIIEGLLVRVAGSPCVFPLSAVEECVDLPESHAEHPARAADETDPATDLAERGKPPRRKGPAPDRRQSLLRIRDELVPYLALDEHFGFPRTGKATGRRVIVVGGEGRRTGLVIDEIIGQHQTVIKPLSLYHRRIDGLAGCTILGDGTVAMILDPAAIVKRAQHGPRLAA